MTINRGSQVKGEARVVYIRESDEQVVHDSGWMEVGPIRRVYLPPDRIEMTMWRIDIYDRMNGGPTGEIPYVLDVDVRAVHASDGTPAAFVDVPSNERYDPAKAYPSAECRRIEALLSIRPGAMLEAITSSDAPLDIVPDVVVAPGGRNLYIDVTNTAVVPIVLTLFAKEVSRYRFVQVCSCVITSKHGIIVATIPWDRVIEPLWRIETRASGGVPNGAKVGIRSYRDSDPERAAAERQQQNKSRYLSSRYVCEGGPRVDGAPPPLRHPAHVAQRATEIELSTVGSVVDREAATLTLMNALAIWSAECVDCNYDALSVIRVGRQLYLRSDAYELFEAFAQGGIRRRNRPPLSPWALLTKATSRVRVLQPGRQAFRAVRPGDRALSKICAHPAADLPPEVRRIRTSLACATDSEDVQRIENVRLTLALRDGPFQCGKAQGAEVVACTTGDLLELNGYDYKFQAAASTLGRGSRIVDLNLVLLHEVGHWLGLDDACTNDAVGDPSVEACGRDWIMANSVQVSRCITSPDTQKLSEALRRAGSRRRRSPHALLWMKETGVASN